MPARVISLTLWRQLLLTKDIWNNHFHRPDPLPYNYSTSSGLDMFAGQMIDMRAVITAFEEEAEKEGDMTQGLEAEMSSSVGPQAFLVAFIVFCLCYLLIDYYRRPKNLPPGPHGFPVVGVLPRLKPTTRHLRFQRWWEEFGDVYSCYMGQRLCVIINGVEAMRECFVKKADDFNGRPWNYFKKLARNKGIVFTDGEVWKEHRRFTLSCLRDFGMGKETLEHKIHEELGFLVQEYINEEEKPVHLNVHTCKAIANIICAIIYGQRFDYEDSVFRDNIQALEQSVRMQSLVGMIQFIPCLELIPKIMPTDKLMSKNVKNREAYAKQQIEQHKDTLAMSDQRDFIDAYLIAMDKALSKNESHTFDESQLLRTIQDLFIAGTETLNTTLKWAFLYMAVHPDIQEKVQKELDAAVGQGRFVSMKDKLNLPYTEATLMECQRMGNIALFSVPRAATRDTTLNGYNIPKGTWIFVNRWGVHASKRYWAKPNIFDPQRFLDKDGKAFKPDAFVPFGIGPRSCLGESLAKMELFIFFASVLQHFKLLLPPGEPVPCLEPQAGINMAPHPYKLIMKQR